MERDLVKRFLTKDGNTRISIYQDTCAENPRYMTDEPLHCDDWSRECTITTKQERESGFSSARNLLEYLIRNYGNDKKIIESLIANGKKIDKEKVDYGTALVYDRSRRGWILIGDISCYFGIAREDGWYEYSFYDGCKNDIDLHSVCEDATDDAIEYFIENFMDDKIKIASYGFGYYGEISFYDSVDCHSKGICWLEKDEFMEYSGCKEEYWKGKTLTEIEWLTDELEAWGDNEVYGFVVEECIKSRIHKEYTNKDKEDEVYEEIEWDETDSCWGFYGEIDKSLEYILDDAGFKLENLVEVDE